MPSIHDDFRKMLARATPARSALDATRVLRFDEVPAADSAVGCGRCFRIWLPVRPVGEDAAKPNP